MAVAHARFLFCLALALAFAACENPAEWHGVQTSPNDSLINHYRTPHFVFFYDTSVYSREKVVANGKVKEAHLKRISEEMQVSFDAEIMVRLISESGEDWAGKASPQKPYLIEETLDYFIRDNGHEIAHVVSFEALGFPNRRRFFVEGLAVAHELDDQPKWARLCFLRDSATVAEMLEETFEAENSSGVYYPLAGAYVEWLKDKFGVKEFNRFYRALGDFPFSNLASLCMRHFDLTLEELHSAFITERFEMAMGSKYCAD